MVKKNTGQLRCAVCHTPLPRINAPILPTVGRCPSCGVGYTYPPPEIPPPPTWLGGEIRPPARWRTVLKRALLHLPLPHVPLLLGIYLPPHPGARALDVGCGPGFYVRALRQLGWQAFGLDIFPAFPSLTPTALQADAHFLPFPASKFRLVTCWHVLEHVRDPLTCLQEARRVLQKGGRILVEVPNMDSWQSHLLGHRWLHWDLERHMWHFTKPTLQRLLQQAGFQQIKVVSAPNSPGWIHSLPISSRWNPIGWAVDTLAALTQHGGVLRAWARA